MKSIERLRLAAKLRRQCAEVDFELWLWAPVKEVMGGADPPPWIFDHFRVREPLTVAEASAIADFLDPRENDKPEST